MYRNIGNTEVSNLRMMGKGKLRILNHILVNEAEFDLFEHSIILGYRGSIVHGTYVSNDKIVDDIDVMGVAILPMDYYLGMKPYQEKRGRFEQFERLPKPEDTIDPWDIVIYEFHKFIRLLINSNPNVIQLLWLPEQFYINVSDIGKELIANRDLFATKAVYHSFNGYAYQQFQKMERGATTAVMGAKRKALVEKYGYDTKNAAHLIRLLKMGIEFLTEGTLYPNRGGRDASQIMTIKRGEYTLAKIKSMAERLFGKCEDAYIHSKLPNKPDVEAIRKLTYELTRRSFGI